MKVAVVLFEGVDLLDVGGPYEVFLTASRLVLRTGDPAPFEAVTVSATDRPVRADPAVRAAVRCLAAPPRGPVGGQGPRAGHRPSARLRLRSRPHVTRVTRRCSVLASREPKVPHLAGTMANPPCLVLA